MPLYQCRSLDRNRNEVTIRLAAKNDAEAIEMARNMSGNSSAHEFELWQDERCVHREEGSAPRFSGFDP
jgi:hypothetical protein